MAAARRILVIDDEEGFARLLQDYFEHLGWQASVAADGLAGFREASRRSYDLITLDINMPGVNGVESLRSMELVGQQAKGVVISGYLTDQIAAECRAAGAAAVLAKPVELAQLGRLAAELIGEPPPAPAG
jgi:CheY-like chemotaxis protein